MQNFAAKKDYYRLIEYIAKSSRKDKGLYDRAKAFLKSIQPEWDDVRLETNILWDVRNYFKNSPKK